jgi:hypothetical protein
MEDIGFSPTGKDVTREVATHWSDTWIWGHTSSEDGLVSIRTGKIIEKGAPIFREPALFSVNPAKIYDAYLSARAKDIEDWYNNLPYDSERQMTLIAEIGKFIHDSPDKAALCPDLNEDLEDAAKVIAIFERHALQRPGTKFHDVLRMICWIQYDDDHPNAVLSFDAFRGLWTVHTIQDIDERGTILLSNM